MFHANVPCFEYWIYIPSLREDLTPLASVEYFSLLVKMSDIPEK